jgi:WD40 repeat protein
MSSLLLHPRRAEAVVAMPGRLERWTLGASPRALAELRGWEAGVSPAAALSASGELVAVPDPDHDDWNAGAVLQLRRSDDLDVARFLRVEDPALMGVTGLSFSPDDRWLASANHNEELRIVDAVSGETLGARPGGAYISGVRFSPDGRFVAAMGTDQGGGVLGLWPVGSDGTLAEPLELDRFTDPPAGAPPWRNDDLADTFGGLAFSADGHRLAVGLQSEWCSAGSEIGVFDVAGRRAVWCVAAPGWSAGPIVAADAVVYAEGEEVTFRRAADGEVLRRLRCPDPVAALAARGPEVWSLARDDPTPRELPS